MTREQIAIEAGKGEALVQGDKLVAIRGSVVAPLRLPPLNFTGKENEHHFVIALRQMTPAEVARQIEQYAGRNRKISGNW